jgi:hypothetical protein
MRRELPSAVTWALLALLGLLVAIAVGIAASELTSRRIGLSSEPIRAGDALAPPPEQYPGQGKRGDGGRGSHKGGDATTPPNDSAPSTTTVPDSSTTAPDDSSAPPAQGSTPEGTDGDGDLDDD